MVLRIVLFLTVLNLFNYTDRFLLSASLVQLKADFSLSDFQGGLLFSAFVVPYLIFTLLLSYRADRTNRLRILKIGSLIWSVAAVATAFAQDYVQLLLCRSFLGVGEAAFAAVAPAVVSQIGTDGTRAKLMSIFTAGLPLGMALGFIVGGSLTGHHGWRFAFLTLGLPALLVTLAFCFLPSGKDEVHGSKVHFVEELRSLLTNKQYLLVIFGSTAYMFVAGGVTHWMPTFIVKHYELTLANANAIFGGAAIGFGLLGTWIGGVLGDRWSKKSSAGYLKVSWLSMVLSLVPFIMVFYSTSAVQLTVWMCLTQFFMFMSTSPVTIAIMQSAHARHASFAMALQIFVSHILGDALSAPLIGKLSDATGDLRLGMLACGPMLLFAALLWYWPTRTLKTSTSAKLGN